MNLTSKFYRRLTQIFILTSEVCMIQEVIDCVFSNLQWSFYNTQIKISFLNLHFFRGRTHVNVFLMSDCYLGIDQEYTIPIDLE